MEVNMSKNNSTRSGCKDVFHAFLVKNANFAGYLDIPKIENGNYIPRKLIPFSKALHSTEYDSWIHFYEDDAVFERIWNNPEKYLETLKKFEGVICPDFSLYRDMPLVMQFWNIYRSHAIGSWLQENGIAVIVNIRYSDARTYTACCTGAPTNSTIAIGSHGCIKCKEDRQEFIVGLEYIVKVLSPKAIVIYGTAPDYIFDKYKASGIQILQFESEFSKSRKQVSA